MQPRLKSEATSICPVDSEPNAVLAAAVRPLLETLENRLLMDGEFGSLVTRGTVGNDTANAATYDLDGNGVVAGSFTGIVDFSPGGVNVFLDATSGSGYVAKYNTAGNMVWVRQLGGSVSDVAVDKNGNILVTGSFSGTKDFDTSAGVTNLTSAGFEDIYIVKFNSEGSLQWARRVGGAGFSDFGNTVGVDHVGNVFVGGSFAGTVDFDPGPSTVNKTATLTDGFVLKLTSNGNYSRVSQLAGNGSEYVNDLAVDDTGTVYAAGRFDKTADFNPGSGTTNLVADNTYGTNYDGFVWKIKSNGTLGFAKKFGGGFWDEGNAIAIDAIGNSYVTGKFTYSAKFNGAGGTLSAFGNSGSDIFVAKYNSEGAYQWAKKLGGGEADEAGLDIAVDGGRNVYVTGYFRGLVTLHPSGFSLASSAGGSDAFVSVLSTDGGFHHAVSYGGTGNDQGRAIAVDALRGNIWVGGSFANTVDFNPKAGVQNASSNGGTDLYLLRLQRTASPLEWAFSTGFGVSEDEGRQIAVDSNGYIYVAGLVRGAPDLDPSAGFAGYGPIGSGADVFVAKFAPDGTYMWSRVATHRENPDWSLGDEKIGGLAVDGFGNVVVVGTFLTTGVNKLDFPNTSEDLQSTDNRTDGFIWKLNTNGGHVFARKFGGENIETADAVAVDSSGNIYVTGMFDYSVQWGPGAGQIIESSNFSLGDYASDDVWVAKYNSSGTIQWVKGSGSGDDDRPTGIAVDSTNGQVYVTGTFKGEFFHSNHMSYYSATVSRKGTLDSFVAKYATSNGNTNQVVGLGGTGATTAKAIDVDASGNTWVGGEFTLTTDFDPSAGIVNRTSAGGKDAFLVKLSSAGAHLFSAKAGAALDDTVNALDVGTDGSVNAVGTFRNNVDFNPSTLHSATLNGGAISSFAWKLNDAGAFRAIHKFGATANDIAVDAAGVAHVVGTFSSFAGSDFDPGAATNFPLTAGSSDIFVMKFNPGTTPSTPSFGQTEVFGNAAITGGIDASELVTSLDR
ncbi:SBBP repeat-containing protein [Humisphaera borealis]|uniref:SBBP repeat-containing protein n=1 Tax=Humisphaera borealis TaxID=2807512 RepID=A0A7M2WR46_9BACT|nr:SBBP repeat-containing protein [Humisphaera borealis]QOV88007.1 SBBP repeat-containing protein [Humisphaera borealis]